MSDVKAEVQYGDPVPRYRITLGQDEADWLRSHAATGSLHEALVDAGARYLDTLTPLPSDGEVERIDGHRVPETVTLTMPYHVARALTGICLHDVDWSPSGDPRRDAARDLYRALVDVGVYA